MQKIMNQTVVAVRGGGDIGTGVAHRLFRCGFKVIVFEASQPTVIRRKVSFAQAVYSGRIEVEGTTAVLIPAPEKAKDIWQDKCIPVLVDPDLSSLKTLQPQILVEATLSKKNTCMSLNLAPLTVALGPGFTAGKDVDIVIETIRGHNLGRIIEKGTAAANTGIPEPVLGYTEKRVLRAPCDGVVKNGLSIGDTVSKGDTVCLIGNKPVTSEVSGVLRGCIMNGLRVKKGAKVGDVDPREIAEYCFTISDKARAIGGSVLEAILNRIPE
jgi:xanthine dehydrogenase accessory factor